MIDDKLLYETVGARLKQLREGQAGGKRGRLTQGELADLVGLERTSITNIENGNQKVSLHVLFRICEQLGASPAELLPSIKDVAQSAPAEESFAFGGTTRTAPPLVAQALAEILSGTK
jgi:transcriptional regulator with XRE-family HTH domain